MSESTFNPLQSENMVLERTRKPLKRITMKNKSTLSIDDDSLFDPLYLDQLKKNALEKLKKAEKNLKKSEKKYMEALDEFNKLFDKKEGGKTRRSNYRARK